MGRNLAWMGLALAGTLVAAVGVAQPVDLSALTTGTGGWSISGEADDDNSGGCVAAAGDVNGDGVGDVILGSSNADPNGSFSGRAYVVFGQRGEGDSVDLSTVTAGTGGFTFNGEAGGDFAGISVAGAGDVNGDGLADVVIGAPLNDNTSRTNNGRAYVVFGKTAVNPAGGAALSTLVSFGIGGFALNGAANGDNAGWRVAGGGDVNGDGLSDILVAAPYAEQGVVFNTGRVYVVFGKTATGPIGGLDLSTVAGGAGGFVITGEAANDQIGWTDLVNAGDVNGDGLADILIPAPLAAPASGGSGRAYVVFGKTTTTAVNLSAITAGVGGFAITREAAADWFVFPRGAGLGDMNDDGLGDIALGWSGGTNGLGDETGVVYLLFGKTSAGPAGGWAINTALASSGFRVTGQASNDNFGDAVSATGDVNGDGRADLLVGARDADPNGTASGRCYLVYGKSTTTGVNVASLVDGSGGMAFDGHAPQAWAGYDVAGAGDANADGRPDLLMAATRVDTNGAAPGIEQGRASVAHVTPTQINGGYFGFVRSGNAPKVGIGASEQGAAATGWVDSRCWIDFTAGASNGRVYVDNVRSITAIAPPPAGSTSANLAKVYWKISTNRTGSFLERVTFRYTDAEIAGIDESTLTILHASTNNNPNGWLTAPNVTIDPVRNEISADTAVLMGGAERYYVLRGELVQPLGLTITRQSTIPTSNQQVAWNVVFSQPVGTTFTLEDIVPAGSLDDQVTMSLSGSGANWVVTALATAADVDGSISFIVPANAATAATGAKNQQVTAPTYFIDEAAASVANGDVNKDGVVNVADITTLGDHIANGTPLP